ncbi:MAG: dihydrofolate reductase [Nitrosomonadales bacterium]|jgi:dihydrofolate reductase|nr:dihydrofolate reductase [Nitrosomonadales bacterium]MBT6818502.1 dihydrofolate reductase [Nitrosomonadales bacterium]MBT7121080.1 dihydrofolate reductase [Nitrosomonadales bacterium]MBT7690145.1 dihydrofolate reductase [Nitrosomonadales bacterium]
MKKITIIVAISENLVIGHRNTLPWHISEDLKNFKKITLNHSVIMGRKTFESIGKPLKYRRNIVISRNKNLQVSGVEIVSSLDDAICLAKSEDEVFIIGGEQIYEIALPIATNMFITKVHSTIEGDAFFPNFDENQWKKLTQNDLESEEGIKFSFISYERAL